MRKFIQVPPKSVILPEQLRKSFDDAADLLLGESMRVRQLQPIGLRPDMTLLFGGRRCNGALLAGLELIDACVTDEPLSESDVVLIQLTENLIRSSLTPWEEYLGAAELMRLNAWKAKDLAQNLRIEPDAVTRLLSPGRCIPEVQNALKETRIGLGQVYHISRAPSEAAQAELLEAALNGATRDELERRVRAMKKPSPASVRVRRVTCPLPSGISVSLSGAELSIDDAIEALADAHRAALKAKRDGLDAKVWSAVMAKKATATT